jgi:hypothetical protein
MYVDGMSNLAQRLAQRAPTIAERSVERVHQNPFWFEKFGEPSARKFGHEDALFHVSYLVKALQLNSPTLFPDYARWLQTMLTTRGMATLHLEQTLQGLADSIKGEGLPEVELALAHIRAALTALIYPAGAARPVMLGRTALVNATLERLDEQKPDWVLGWGDEGRTLASRELKVVLTYLADALALRRPELFEANLRWYAGFLKGRGISEETLGAALDGMTDALESLGPEDRELARAALLAGRQVLESATTGSAA